MTHCIVTAAIPRTIDLFLGPHIEQLRKRGLEVHVVSSGCPSVAREQGLQFHQVNFSRSPLNLIGHYRAWRQYRDLLDRLTANGERVLLHLHTPIAASLARLARRRRHPVTVLYMAHGLHFLPGEKNLYYWLERLMARLTDLYVLINDDDVQSTRSALVAGDASRWVKIPGVGMQNVSTAVEKPGVPGPAGAQDPPDPAIKRVLVLGVLEPRKHPELALRAVAALDDDVHVHFCGDGPMEADLRELASSLGCAERVHFEGWTEQVEPWFARCHCLLFLSDREGLPMAVAEALTSRLPVVAFDIRGVRDLLHELDGWLIPQSRSAPAVAEALQSALQSRIDAPAYARRAAQFSLQASLAAHGTAIDRLLGQRQVDATGQAPETLPVDDAMQAPGISPKATSW